MWLLIASLVLVTWSLIGCVGYLCRGLLISNNRLHRLLAEKIDPGNTLFEEPPEVNSKDLVLTKKQNTYDLVMSSGEGSEKELEILGIERLS